MSFFSLGLDCPSNLFPSSWRSSFFLRLLSNKRGSGSDRTNVPRKIRHRYLIENKLMAWYFEKERLQIS
jgi:hypothetical protein